jgi:hypothetical protein
VFSIFGARAPATTTAAEAVTLRAAAERKLSEDLRALTERQSGATQALREYVTLQRDAGTGLLLGSDSDARAAREIAAQLRSGQQERARAEAEVKRDQERVLREQERQNQQVTDSIVRYGADRFADMFAENSRGWAGMLDTFRSTFRSLMARIAAEAIIRPIIAPIVQGLGLGQLGAGGGGLNLGSLLGFGGGAMGGPAGVADAGSTQGALSQAGQLAGLRSAGSFGNLGNAFMGNGLANTGFGFVDNALNASLMSPSLSTTGAVGAGGVPIVSGTPGLTAAGALGGAAGIAGGAYGIYSGLQRGGIGGYTSAAGGLLSAGLGGAMLAGMAVPGIGWAVAAGLAIAGALMPGQQASSRGQLSRINLGSGDQSFEGLGGDRFSAGNRDAASNTVSSIADMARQIGDRLGGARIGGNVAVGVTSGRGSGPGTLYLEVGVQKGQFANTEEGSKELAAAAAEMVLQEFRAQSAATGDYAGILNASGSLDALSANLEWYENTYKTLIKAREPVSAFQQSIDQLTAQFEPAITKARELSLSVDAMTAARDREIQMLRDQRGQQLYRFDAGIDIRQARLRGDLVGAEGLSFDIAATQQVAQARAELQDLGVSAEEAGARILRLEQTLAAERLRVIEEAGQQQARAAQEAAQAQARAAEEAARAAEESARAQTQAAQSVLDWLNAQALGASSSLSPTARLAEAERQFNAASASGDVRALTSAADALLINSRDVFGGATEAFVQREAFVRSTVAQRTLQGNQGGSTEVVTALSQMVAVLQAELSSLGAKFDALTAETRRGNNQALAA